MKTLYVYADFDWLDEPMQVGELGYESLRGSDSYSFKYDNDWLRQDCQTDKSIFIVSLKRSWQRPEHRLETLQENMKKVMFLLVVGVMCLTACAQKKGGERGTRQGGHMVINKDSDSVFVALKQEALGSTGQVQATDVQR